MEFQEKLIKLNQAFENKEEAIRYCGRLLVEAGHVNEAYVDAMVQRDADYLFIWETSLQFHMEQMQLKKK